VRRALVPLLLVTLLIVAFQLSILSSLRIAGTVVMLVWLWPLTLGLAGFTGLAMVGGAASGLLLDTHATTPFGLSAAVALILGYAASRLGREGVGDLDSAAWWVTPVLGALGGAAAPILYVALGALALNFNLWRGSVLDMAGVNAVAFFFLARPVTRVARAVGRIGGSRR
jgi:hypothetical protein